MPEPTTGFFGKTPSRGDFVQRGLDQAWIKGIDAWLQQCIQSRRTGLGDGWLNSYLTSPIWRFCISPGVLDSNAWIGAVMPSVDRVNRHFPLLVAASLPETNGVIAAAAANAGWFNEMEQQLLATLDDDDLDLDAFAQQIALRSLTLSGGPAATAVGGVEGDWYAARLNGATFDNESAADLLQATLGARWQAPSLWYTLHTAPARQLIIAPDLPDPETFAPYLFPGAEELDPLKLIDD